MVIGANQLNEKKVALKNEILRILDCDIYFDARGRNELVKSVFDFIFEYGQLQPYIEDEDVSDIDGTAYNEFSIKRKGIRDKWKKMGSPQTRSQKHFVTKFFEPLIVYNNINNNYFSSIFGNEFPAAIKIPNLGEFKNAQIAYKAFKQKVIIECKNDYITKNIWGTIKEDAMYTILSYKFDQHIDISNKLLNTGLRPVIIHSNNVFWGYNEKTGRNIIGKMITKLREELYLE
jgi:hypothetical protein